MRCPGGRRRTLQRQLGITLATAALLLALGSAPAPAATITVDGTFCTLADGVDVLNETVSVTLEGFSETIPPGSFRRARQREREDGFRGQRFVYNGPSGGIRRLELVIGGVDGRFSIDARRLDLDGLELPATVAVTLRIGDDVAQTMIPLNRRGSLINRRGEQVAEGD